jgi:hypothetical protein
MPKSSGKTMKTGRSESDSDYSGSSRSSSSGKKGRSRKATTGKRADVFPPRPSPGHPNQMPKPELRAKMLAAVLAREGTRVSNVSEVAVDTYYLVIAKNRKNQPVAYCLKATGVSGNKASFYMRDFRSAGFGYKPASLMATATFIYKITPELMATLEAGGMWFNEGEYSI